MKRLYARLVLWLIRPALEDVERRVSAQGEIESAMRIDGDMTLRARLDCLERQAIRVVTTAGGLHFNAGLHLSETGQPIPSGDMTAGSR